VLLLSCAHKAKNSVLVLSLVGIRSMLRLWAEQLRPEANTLKSAGQKTGGHGDP
jgi:hypothetical protein